MCFTPTSLKSVPGGVLDFLLLIFLVFVFYLRCWQRCYVWLLQYYVSVWQFLYYSCSGCILYVFPVVVDYCGGVKVLFVVNGVIWTNFRCAGAVAKSPVGWGDYSVLSLFINVLSLCCRYSCCLCCSWRCRFGVLVLLCHTTRSSLRLRMFGFCTNELWRKFGCCIRCWTSNLRGGWYNYLTG